MIIENQAMVTEAVETAVSRVEDPRLREILQEADVFVRRMPTDKVGLLFLKDGQVVQPDPDHLEAYQTHAGQRGGHWPSSGEISSAMLESYGTYPNL